MVHDFSGHPFQVQLARQLSTQGFDVTHVYCPSFETPHGEVGDSRSSYRSIGVGLSKPFNKYSPRKRLVQELEYSFRLFRQVRRTRPDVMITANTPLIAAWVLQLALWATRQRVVFWQQDIYSLAMAQHAGKRLGLPGRLIGKVFIAMEKWLLRSSKHVVVISADFLSVLREWGVDESKITVVHNWAPLDEMPRRDRPNDWSRAHGVSDDQTVLLYAGTLGLKHQPSLLLDLAEAFTDRPDVRLIVASEGVGARWLTDQAHGDVPVLEVIPFQPFEVLPEMLATADVLLVLLQPDAGVFSVPSKVMTYQCAARAVLASMPEENLASRTLRESGAGIVVEAGDSEQFVAAARELVDDPERRDRMGAAAGRYAAETFDIDRIGSSFVRVIRTVVGEPVGELREPAVSASGDESA